MRNLITRSYARKTGDALKVDWSKVSFDEFAAGMNVEMEHMDVTKGDPIETAKIALAHLKELPDYYTRLARMERRALAAQLRTFPVSGAARSRTVKAGGGDLTHAVRPDLTPLCSKVRPDSVLEDEFWNGDEMGTKLAPTCPICLARDPRFGGG